MSFSRYSQRKTRASPRRFQLWQARSKRGARDARRDAFAAPPRMSPCADPPCSRDNRNRILYALPSLYGFVFQRALDNALPCDPRAEGRTEMRRQSWRRIACCVRSRSARTLAKCDLHNAPFQLGFRLAGKSEFATNPAGEKSPAGRFANQTTKMQSNARYHG